MALFSINNSCLATISCLALVFATVACSSGSDSNDTGPVTSTGGSAGTGPSAGGDTGGGAGGAGGAVAPPVFLYTFTDLMDVNAAEAANTTPPANDLTPTTTFSLDSTDGAPEPTVNAGSLKIEAPFSAFTTPDQAVDFQFKLVGAPLDLTGKTLFLYLKLDSGFVSDPNAPGGFIFYAKSGPNWDWGQAPWQNLDPTRVNKWYKYIFKLASAQPATGGVPFDPSQVMSIGLKIDTGSPTSTPTADPGAAVFHLDTIGYQADQ
jgi:hypothetical protein